MGPPRLPQTGTKSIYLNHNATQHGVDVDPPPVIMGGALGSVPHTPRCTWCTGHAPALLHVVAEPSHVARVVWWLKGSGRQAPGSAKRGAGSAWRAPAGWSH